MLFIGVDIGGTFTDIVAFEEKTADNIRITKISTSQDEPEKAVVDALRQYRPSADQVSLVTHATTVATNALLTHRGLAKTALITNRGFRDVVEIGRQRRPEIYNLKTERPIPLVPRRARYTIKGRTLTDGSVIEKIDVHEARKIAQKIVHSRFAAVAISMLNSYANSDQEVETREILRRAGFTGPIDISSEVDPEYREYERTSTTVVNSALSRSVSAYLTELNANLRQIGFQCPIYVMNSDGTVGTIAHASKRPVSLIESGPAAGALAGRALAKCLGIRKALTFDMGGTTAKAGTVTDYQPDLAYEFEAAARTYHGRSIKGSGYPVRQPFIDLAEVSAGGGTIASRDDARNLRVGPESAGADPGPAAYGKGNRQPTVTDANLVAGRINPGQLLGGGLKLRYDLALNAIKALSRKLGSKETKTVANILRIVNDNMSKALRLVTIERGRDPREFTLMTFGGAGPLHACDLAEELEVTRIVIPMHPGLFSAFGLLTAELSRTFSEPILRPASKRIESYFRKLRQRAKALLNEEGFTTYRTIEQVDLRYEGQSYEITLPYRKNSNLTSSFGRAHKNLYGYSSKDTVEAVNATVRAMIPTPKAILIKKRVQPTGLPAPSSFRRVLLEDSWRKIPIYDRESLTPGMSGTGPSIVEEYDSTTVVGLTWAWKIDGYGNIDMVNRSRRAT